MRYIALMMILAVALVACTAPPEDVPRAQPAETDDMADEMKDEEAMDHDMDDMDEKDMEETMDKEMDDMEHGMDEKDSMDDMQMEGIEAEGGMPDTAVPIDMAASSFEFTGYAPGKEHAGTFTEMEGVLTFEDGVLVAAEGAIQTASVSTGIEGLDTHLKNEDFFHVEMYPTISIETSAITEDEVTADISFHGVTQELVFPATITENGISADTVINMADFGISYTGVNDEVRVTFSFMK